MKIWHFCIAQNAKKYICKGYCFLCGLLSSDYYQHCLPLCTVFPLNMAKMWLHQKEFCILKMKKFFINCSIFISFQKRIHLVKLFYGEREKKKKPDSKTLKRNLRQLRLVNFAAGISILDYVVTVAAMPNVTRSDGPEGQINTR